MQKICFSCKWVGGFAELSCTQATITAGGKKKNKKSSILRGDALLLDDKGERETDPPRALDLISAALFLFLKHLDTRQFCAH